MVIVRPNFRWPMLLLIVSVLPVVPLECRAQNCGSLREDFRSSIFLLRVERTHSTTGATTTKFGTAFLVSDRGFALTNDHVVRNEPNYSVTISGAESTDLEHGSPMEVIGEDSEHDIAVLRFRDVKKSLRVVPIGDAAAIEEDELLCSFGYPLGNKVFKLVKHEGKISATGGPSGWWYTQMKYDDGESGAPVFASRTRRVIALQVGERDDAQNLSYLIPIYLASKVYKDNTGLDLLPHLHTESDVPPSGMHGPNPLDGNNKPYVEMYVGAGLTKHSAGQGTEIPYCDDSRDGRLVEEVEALDGATRSGDYPGLSSLARSGGILNGQVLSELQISAKLKSGILSKLSTELKNPSFENDCATVAYILPPNTHPSAFAVEAKEINGEFKACYGYLNGADPNNDTGKDYSLCDIGMSAWIMRAQGYSRIAIFKNWSHDQERVARLIIWFDYDR